MTYDENLQIARRAFADFLNAVPKDARCVALHDSDADGVCAGVVWQRALESKAKILGSNLSQFSILNSSFSTNSAGTASAKNNRASGR